MDKSLHILISGSSLRTMSRSTMRKVLGYNTEKLSEDEWLALIDLYFHNEDYDVKINLDIHCEQKMIACAIVDAIRGFKKFGLDKSVNLFEEIFYKLFDIRPYKLIIYSVSNKPYLHV